MGVLFFEILGQLPHKVKIVVPGNHELGFEDGEEMADRQMAALGMLGINKPYELLTNCTYLCDRQMEARSFENLSRFPPIIHLKLIACQLRNLNCTFGVDIFIYFFDLFPFFI